MVCADTEHETHKRSYLDCKRQNSITYRIDGYCHSTPASLKTCEMPRAQNFKKTVTLMYVTDIRCLICYLLFGELYP